jgi:hypothetical protein
MEPVAGGEFEQGAGAGKAKPGGVGERGGHEGVEPFEDLLMPAVWGAALEGFALNDFFVDRAHVRVAG